MTNGDVVTVMVSTGAEYVGKLVSDDDNGVTLDNPRFVSVTQEGMGFANGIAMTGVKDPKKVTFRNVIFVTETNQEVISAYRQTVSGLITPTSGGLKL